MMTCMILLLLGRESPKVEGPGNLLTTGFPNCDSLARQLNAQKRAN